MKTTKFFMPMHLQFFAENSEETTQETKSTETNENTTEESKGTGKTFSRDDVAKMIAAETKKAVDAAEVKWRAEKDEADKLAEMNEDEKSEHEKKTLLKRIAELEKKDNLAAMSKEASKMLSEASIMGDDETLGFVVRDTAEATKNAVDKFISLVDKAAEEKTRQALSGKSPKVNMNPGKQLSKKEIMAIKDTTERQRMIQENMHLFKK
jgi:NADH dehydrogenase/NADH:ubiquinone oxidoreductase subunit G